MAASSKSAVVLAVVGNGLLTVLKFVAFLFSGSGSMLSEAIHSFADTSNQALMWVGISRSEREPDEQFHYGYGGERYLFALLSAVGIFVLGCGVTVYHGVNGLLHPHPIDVGWLDYGVLAVSACVEAFVLYKAYLVVRESMAGTTLLAYLRSSTDPTAVAVVLEDSVAVVGVFVAAGGIWLSQRTGNTQWDSIGSILIGLMLGGVAAWLAVQNRALILRPAMPKKVEQGALAFIQSQPSVRTVRDVKSMVMGADRFKLKAEVEFDGGVIAAPLEEWVAANVPDPADAEAVAVFTARFGAQVIEMLGDEIDRIEEELAERYPRVQYVDLETD